MSKDYKGYELIKEITEGNIKDGTTIGVFDLSVCDIFVTDIKYKDKKLNWEEGKFNTSYLVNPNCYFRIVEEQEEIDIQSIEEIQFPDNTVLRDTRDLIVNRLVQAVKQLDKNIKEK